MTVKAVVSSISSTAAGGPREREAARTEGCCLLPKVPLNCSSLLATAQHSSALLFRRQGLQLTKCLEIFCDHRSDHSSLRTGRRISGVTGVQPGRGTVNF